MSDANAYMYNRAALTASAGMAAGSIARAYKDGQVRCSLEVIEGETTAAGSTVNLGTPLPDGAVVLGFIISADTTSSLTIDIGDANDADLYVDGYGATNVTAFVAARQPTYVEDTSTFKYEPTVGLGYVVGTNDNDNQLIVTTAGATLNATIVIGVIYAV